MRLKVSNVCQLLGGYTYYGDNRNGIKITNNGDGTFTVNGTATNDTWFLQPVFQFQTSNPGYHTYLLDIGQYSGNANAHGVIYFYDDDVNSSVALIGTQDSSAVIHKINGPIAGRGAIIQARFAIVVFKGVTVTNWTIRPQLFDLTEMYGAGHEPTTVAQFRQDYTNEMYEYSPVCWKKFRRLKYVTETKNLFDYKTSAEKTQTSNGITLVLNADYFELRGQQQAGKYIELGQSGFNIPFEVGKTYVLSADTIVKSGGKVFMRARYTDGESPLTEWETVSWNLFNGTIAKRFTPTRPGYFDKITFYNASDTTPISGDYIIRIQIEKGSTATPYQPYGYLPLNRGKYIANKEPVQLLDKSNRATTTIEGITFTNNGDGTWTVVGTAPDDPINHSYVSYTILTFSKEFTQKYFIPGHKIVVAGGKVNYDAFVQWILGWTGGYIASNSAANYPYTITEYPENWGGNNIELRVNKGKTVNFTFKPQLFDLTEMYGAGNEPTTVAQFRADYPNELYDYNPYNAITFR